MNEAMKLRRHWVPFLIGLLILAVCGMGFSACNTDKKSVLVHKMGKVNKKVRKKGMKTHRISKLKKRQYRPGKRKTYEVGIKQPPKKNKKKKPH